ncbi:MAG: homoserine kinase [Chloroflexi bacterium]|nr:MAG: homoserine kinase [Chloroflexota bacterium]
MSPIASVEVPASSANLGSGAGCFAAALSLKLRAELFPGDQAGILLDSRGEGAPGPDDDPDDNLLMRAFREGLRAARGAGQGAGAWRIEVSSMIPAARGLGSSAAAIVAGLLLGAAAGRQAPSADELLALAAALEGHPESVAAALYGGITLAVAQGIGEAPVLRRFRVPEAWIPVLFVAATTSNSRPPTPGAVSVDEAERALARAALLATAVITSDAGLLNTAMDDRLRQPQRLLSMPGTGELIQLAQQRGAAGAALSGGGPSVLAICDSPISAHSVEKAWNAAGLPGMATRLRFDTGGARLHAGVAAER